MKYSLRNFSALLPVAALLAGFSAVGVGSPAVAADKISFSEDIFPIIQVRCLECHRPEHPGTEMSGLDMTSYAGLMKGTEHGPMIVPGDAFASNLMVLIEGRGDPSLRMPHGKRRMSSCDIDLFRRWINQGAKDN